MKRFMLLAALIAVSAAANAVPLAMQANYQVSNGAALSTLVWNGADAGTAWGTSVGIVASNATWDWNGTTLTGSGLFWTTSHIGSNPLGSAVLSDKVLDLVITPAAHFTTATTYNCVEGDFLATVGAQGCAEVNTGLNFISESSVAYNVGGDVGCVHRTVGGDDTIIMNPRGIRTAAANGGCDATFGAFDLYTIAASGLSLGNSVILSETASLAQINACKAGGNGSPGCSAIRNQTWFEFTVVPVPAAVWLLGSALGLLGCVRRKAG